MPAAQNILIVGGGLAGMACAISMSKAGHQVSLIDIDPEWRAYGAGITIQAPTFRALHQLGLAGDVAAAGFSGRGSRVRLADGTLLDEVFATKLEPGLPDGGGIMRPMLHSILSRETRNQGVNVRLGITVKALEDIGTAVRATFSDETFETYNFIVGADGIFSTVRKMIFPDAPSPRFTGQGAFRTIAPRPPELDMIETYLGNPIKAGVTPISQDELYMFTLTPEPNNIFLTYEQQIARLQEVLSGFGGLIAEIRDSLGPDSRIVYRPLETLFLDQPWYEGRIVLIGDAVHATTPHLASGAGSAFEDAILLAEYVTQSRSVEQAFREWTDRRFNRCRLVISNSIRLGEMELAGDTADAQGRLYEESLALLAEPA